MTEEDKLREIIEDLPEEDKGMTLSEALQQKRELQTLLDSPGWELFKIEILRLRDEMLINLYQPKEKLEVNKEHMSGVIYGLSTYLDLPEQMINAAQGTIDIEKQQEEEKKEQEDALQSDNEGDGE
jgi:hypothetical protein